MLPKRRFKDGVCSSGDTLDVALLVVDEAEEFKILYFAVGASAGAAGVLGAVSPEAGRGVNLTGAAGLLLLSVVGGIVVIRLCRGVACSTSSFFC